jgi:hypothetical protein
MSGSPVRQQDIETAKNRLLKNCQKKGKIIELLIINYDQSISSIKIDRFQSFDK